MADATGARRVVVYHGYYGCESGCCGHIVKMGDEERFAFDHPYGEGAIEFARRLVEAEFGAEHCADLDWKNCRVEEDC